MLFERNYDFFGIVVMDDYVELQSRAIKLMDMQP